MIGVAPDVFVVDSGAMQYQCLHDGIRCSVKVGYWSEATQQYLTLASFRSELSVIRCRVQGQGRVREIKGDIIGGASGHVSPFGQLSRHRLLADVHLFRVLFIGWRSSADSKRSGERGRAVAQTKE